MNILSFFEPKDMLFLLVLGVAVSALLISLFRKGNSCDSVDASSGAEAGSWEGYGDSSSDPPTPKGDASAGGND